MKPDTLLQQWLVSAQYSMSAHYDAARQFEDRHTWIGVFATILSIAVGTTVFATLQKDTGLTAQLATGFASILAAVITGLQTFLKYDKRAEGHKSAGAAY